MVAAAFQVSGTSGILLDAVFLVKRVVPLRIPLVSPGLSGLSFVRVMLVVCV